MADHILKIKDLHKGFPIRSGILGRETGRVHAVRGVSLDISANEVLGLVGESGCGKSTLSMLVLRLIASDRGAIEFDGADITKMPERALRPIRRHMQVVFQDPYASLNPRMTIEDIVAEPLVVHRQVARSERRDKVASLLSQVGLSADAMRKYPHEFSGGQRQRIGIARAIALTPKFIIADEPVSALDVSIRGEILNLLGELREKFSLTYLFISHDLTVVRHISDRIAVMYLGKIMELFPAEGLSDARHPYTRALVASIPVPDPAAARAAKPAPKGDVPSPINPPAGCPFHPRCPHAKDLCREAEPKFEEYRLGFAAACHFIKEI